MPPQPSQLDPQLVTLAKALRQTESQGNFQATGKSGEYGAYQFMPDTWNAASKKFLGQSVPLTQATPQQQNEVAYKQLAEWKQQHPDWNIGNFASAWNAGPGKPDAYLGFSGTNSKGVKYDTAAYAKSVAENYHMYKLGVSSDPSESPIVTNTPAPEGPPSVGGFAHNVLSSGAGLLANVGEAVLHPIQTIQNIGGAAVGGLEKAAGQQTENTQKFDNLVSFFKDRYGSLDNLEKTLYHDPVGVAADLSALLGGAGLGVKAAGLATKAAGAADAAGRISKAGSALNRASELTNPLTPLAVGAGKLANVGIQGGAEQVGRLAGFEPATIDAIRANPEAFTPEQIANTTRDAVSSEVESAFRTKLATQSATGKAYEPIRDGKTIIPVDRGFLESQFREKAGLDIKDGEIIATPNSKIRSGPEIGKLQQIFDLYKPTFQKGTMSVNEFLNLREDLAKVAYNDLGKKNTTVARITDEIRHGLNEKYRYSIPGLDELDLKFSNQEQELKNLRKGLFDKNGRLNDTATNLIANAANKGNEARLERLEQIVPGITQKLKVLKAIEDIRNSGGTKVGTYGKSIAEYGSIVGGLATGQAWVVATGVAAAIISDPARAVEIIKGAASIDPKIVPMVMTRLARYATLSGEGDRATQTGDTSGQPVPEMPPDNSQTDPVSPSSPPEEVPQSQPGSGEVSLEDLAKTNNFDLAGARKAGYSDDEIRSVLTGPKQS